LALTSLSLSLFFLPGIPPLKEPMKWSQDLLDFTAKCLDKDSEKRKDANELLSHPFMNRSCKPKEFGSVIIAAKQLRDSE
jgi:p21-activated kinase 1